MLVSRYTGVKQSSVKDSSKRRETFVSFKSIFFDFFFFFKKGYSLISLLFMPRIIEYWDPSLLEELWTFIFVHVWQQCNSTEFITLTLVGVGISEYEPWQEFWLALSHAISMGGWDSILYPIRHRLGWFNHNLELDQMWKEFWKFLCHYIYCISHPMLTVLFLRSVYLFTVILFILAFFILIILL